MGEMNCEHATINYDNGDLFEGQVMQGRKQGKHCNYTYINGDKYTGAFKNDVKCDESALLNMPRLSIKY
mgnify:CR=1 FL=1